jgi:hypothetical protein
MLMPGAASGSGRRHDSAYWVWPLPPPGQLTIVCQWPAYAIEESSTMIDAQVILDAAARASLLWPDDEEPGDGPVATLHLPG